MDRLVGAQSPLSSFSIPETIGHHVFNGCARLALQRLPTSLKIIGDGAFHGCTSLNKVQLSIGCCILERMRSKRIVTNVLKSPS